MRQPLVSQPNPRERQVQSVVTPAERRAELENDPKALAILKQNRLTAQDYLIGVPTLGMAIMAAQGLGN
jgi:hypothetical protein